MSVRKENPSKGMILTGLLTSKKREIVRWCFNRIAETYPEGIGSFLKKESDPFANPVGSTITRTLNSLLKILADGGASDGFRPVLEGLLRIKATRNPSLIEGLSLISILKQAIRSQVETELVRSETGNRTGIMAEYLGFDTRLDEAVLIACDIYLTSRRNFDETRINELRAEKERVERVFRVLQS